MAKKTATKTTTKTAAKKVAVKKAVKAAAAKKAPAKKVAAKKAPAKKAAAKKAPVKKTTIIARVDVGFGNSLYLRGEGNGLSWNKGTPLENVGPYEWTFSTAQAKGDLSFKFLINDEKWAEGDNLTVAKGDTSISLPVFVW